MRVARPDLVGEKSPLQQEVEKPVWALFVALCRLTGRHFCGQTKRIIIIITIIVVVACSLGCVVVIIISHLVDCRQLSSQTVGVFIIAALLAQPYCATYRTMAARWSA